MTNPEEQFEQSQELISRLEGMKKRENIPVDPAFKLRLRAELVSGFGKAPSAEIIEEEYSLKDFFRQALGKFKVAGTLVPVFLMVLVVFFSFKNVYFDRPAIKTDFESASGSASGGTASENMPAQADDQVTPKQEAMAQKAPDANPAEAEMAEEKSPEQSSPSESASVAESSLNQPSGTEAAQPGTATDQASPSAKIEITSESPSGTESARSGTVMSSILPAPTITFKDIPADEQEVISRDLISPLRAKMEIVSAQILQVDGIVTIQITLKTGSKYHFWYQRAGQNWQTLGVQEE